MKTLQMVLLVLVIGFGSSIPEKTNLPENYHYNSMTGGLLTIQILKPNKFMVIGVEGGYEYYLQYVKFKLDYQKDREDQDLKKDRVSPSCNWLPWI